MKREMDVIRKILIESENGNLNNVIEGVPEDVLRFHKRLLIEANLIEGAIAGSGEVPDAIMIRKVTWQGYDLLDSIREESRWNQIKELIMSGGKAMTVEVIKLAAKRLFENF